MSPLILISNRVVFLHISTSANEEMQRELYTWQDEILSVAETDMSKRLVVLCVCGHGVIIKPDDAEISRRIKSDPATFHHSSINGTTAFIRQERLNALLLELANVGIVPISIICIDSSALWMETMQAIKAQLRADILWRQLIRPNRENSMIWLAASKRLVLPVLCILLMLLSVNAYLAPKVNARNQRLQAQFMAKEQALSNRSSVGEAQRKLLDEFRSQKKMQRAILCDRIVRDVPEQAVLTTLKVEPLLQRIENKKQIQRQVGVVTLGGTTSSVDDISYFTTRLSETFKEASIRLVNVEKDHANNHFEFKIEMQL